jgi:hypothetical protein
VRHNADHRKMKVSRQQYRQCVQVRNVRLWCQSWRSWRDQEGWTSDLKGHRGSFFFQSVD